jgi:2-iminobutanoate/2-iminopropanoate deaminase
MTVQVINTDKAPAAIGPYSQGISAGPFTFISGQLGMDPQTGELVSDALAPQTRQVLTNLKKIVEASGAGLEQVVAVDAFLTDMAAFGEFNEIYQEFFSNHRPARAVVEVSGLPKGACVEVKCIVYSG